MRALSRCELDGGCSGAAPPRATAIRVASAAPACCTPTSSSTSARRTKASSGVATGGGSAPSLSTAAAAAATGRARPSSAARYTLRAWDILDKYVHGGADPSALVPTSSMRPACSSSRAYAWNSGTCDRCSRSSCRATARALFQAPIPPNGQHMSFTFSAHHARKKKKTYAVVPCTRSHASQARIMPSSPWAGPGGRHASMKTRLHGPRGAPQPRLHTV
jgi:hypothetical protein